jgi:hypothetical protein
LRSLRVRSDGIASFDRIRYRRHDADVFMWAFDLIELNGDDLRRDPLAVRKATKDRQEQRRHQGRHKASRPQSQEGGEGPSSEKIKLSSRTFEPRFRLSGDPILGFALGLEPADVLLLPARMPCEHMPFIPQLDGFNDYRRGRSRHRALTAPGLRRAGDHVGPKNQRRPVRVPGEHIGWPFHQRYASPSDPRITYTRELPWEDSAMSSDLTELGQDAIAAVSRGVADGAPLVKCQLLASAFYEALRNELRKADATNAAPCSPSRISAIEARPPTSALCRPWLNSRGRLICSSPLSRPLKRCSPCHGHAPCSA